MVIKIGRVILLLAVCGLIGGCDDVRVYGSVGVSSYGGGGYYGHRGGTSMRVGGRIY